MNRLNLRTAFAVYQLDIPKMTPDRPFLIGCCALTGLPALQDAPTYEEWRYVDDRDDMRVMVLGIFATRDEAEAMQSTVVMATNAYLNTHGGRCEPPAPNGVRGAPVRDLSTGIRYDSANQAAKMLGVTSAAIYKHLKGDMPTVRGRRFERIEE